MNTECTRPGCNNPIRHNPKAKRPRKFCSNACRQKSYRLRQVPNRNIDNVTGNSYSDILAALEVLTQKQLESIRERIDIRLQSLGSGSSLLYYRKGKGVVHLSVQRNVTFCGRDTEGMTKLSSEKGGKVCQKCSTVRDTKTWWHGWREVFGND